MLYSSDMDNTDEQSNLALNENGVGNADDNEVPPLIGLDTEFPIFLEHKKTEGDANNPYPIAWHGDPFVSSSDSMEKEEWVIRTQWSSDNEFRLERVADLASMYSDFKQKILA